MTPDRAPADDQKELEEISGRILAYFGRHLVGLMGTYFRLDSSGNDIGNEQFFAFSGFAMSLRNVWYLVTAGHCIEDLEKAVAGSHIHLTSTRLADFFGSEAKVEDTSYFDYQANPKLYIYDKAAGLDFAVLPLRDWYRATLTANGVEAITEGHWINQDIGACSFFAILGFPTVLVNDPAKLHPYGDRMAGVVNPVMVFVDPVTTTPQYVPATTFSWFVGKVKSAQHLSDIKGMSGGPVFGFRKRHDGQLEYWIIALQSSWYPQSRITLGCPVRTFAALVEAELGASKGGASNSL